ncbi:MAG: DUF4844 domain-containing protein [Micropepsaceae bacterium]
MALKVTLGVLIIIVVTYLAIVAGLLFELWPTTRNDHELTVTAERLDQLRALRARQKFVPEPDIFYFGAPNEVIRLRAEAPLNALLNRLISDLPTNSKKSFVLQCFKDTLRQFDGFDTDEQERMGQYLEEIMDALGIESSEKLISVWRYRFPL